MAETKKKWIKTAAENAEPEHDGGPLGKQTAQAEALIHAGRTQAHKHNQALASHKAIRKSMYGKE